MKLDIRYVAAGAAIGALISLGILPMASAAAVAEATHGGSIAIAQPPIASPPAISQLGTQPGISPVIQDRVAQWARDFAAGDTTAATNAPQADFNAVRVPGLAETVSDLTAEAVHNCYGFSLSLQQPTVIVNGIANQPAQATTPASVLVLAYPGQPSTYEYFVGNRACTVNPR